MTAEFQPRDPHWDAKVRESFARQSFMDTIGARIDAVAPGRCEIVLPFRADLCQHYGYLHGGVITGIAANAAGYAAYSLMPAASAFLGVEYKINMMDTAAGEQFRALGSVVRAGRTLYVVECEVVAEAAGARNTIAHMLATMMRLEEKTAAAEARA